jgi:hypothetical protein
MNTSNLKDTLTTIFAIVGVLGGVALTIPILPSWIGGALVAASVGVIGVLSGKTPNGSTKTPLQVAAQNDVVPEPPKK